MNRSSNAPWNRRKANTWLQGVARRARTMEQRLRRLPTAEEGTIAQVSLLAMMGCVLAIGLVGNVARITHEKVEVQNSADATAHATALWHARSLNAITATNHLMGELTAICVLHEAIGGPELDLNERNTPTELKDADDLIENTPEAIASQRIPFDKKLVNQVKDTIGEGGETYVGGSLYDARLALKHWVIMMFEIKVAAAVLEKIPYTTAIGVALHAAASAVLIKCLVEWAMLEVVEETAIALKEPKQQVQDLAIKILSDYQQRIADDDPSGRTGPIEKSLEQSIKALEGANRVESTSFRERLPIVKEREPEGNGAGGEVSSYSIATRSFSAIKELDSVIEFVESVVKKFNKIADLIGAEEINLSSFPIPPKAEPETALKNPTKVKYVELKADWRTEERSQWNRATFPWVHSGRAKLLGLFNQETMLTFSRMPTFYGHWTNRLSVVKSYECRSGVRMGRNEQPKFAMYCLVDRGGDSKGKESWRDHGGSREAEQLFTVIGFSRRSVTPLFSPSVFGTSQYDQFCLAQAIFYNANAPDRDGDSENQPIVAWDTLNWLPNSDVPEYGRTPRETRGNVSDFFRGLVGQDFANPPRIQLNWQSKLVPVSQSRLNDALRSNRLDGGFREPMEKAARSLSRLSTH